MHEARKGLTGDPRNAHMSNFPHMGSAKGLAGLRTGDYGVRTGDRGHHAIHAKSKVHMGGQCIKCDF